MDAPQFEFDFKGNGDPSASSGGLESWRDQRRRQLELTARRFGLPLGHRVEVSLLCGLTFRGLLHLHEPGLFLPSRNESQSALFEVDRVPFAFAEVVSCIALD